VAQVPLSKEPRHHMTFENPQLRILDVNIPPGDKSLDHRHDLDIATISMSAGTNCAHPDRQSARRRASLAAAW
jgi:hypothetical protein